MWFFLALSFALWTSISILIVKHLLKSLHPRTYFLVINLFTAPFMFLIIMYFGSIPNITSKFFLLLSISGILDLIAFFAVIWAIKISPISLVSPISSFNPVFTAVFALAILGEVPTLSRFGGILLVVVGAYLLNVGDIKHGFLAPIKNLATHRGVQLSFLAYFIWGITPIFQKQAIFQTEPTMPIFASFVGYSLLTIFSLPFTLSRTKQELSLVRQHIGWFLLLAPFSALASWAAFTTFSLTNLGYATAIFKLSVLFTILWGWLIFKEERIKERLWGGGVMLLGTVLLVL